jgi:hypothetical protein
LKENATGSVKKTSRLNCHSVLSGRLPGGLRQSVNIQAVRRFRPLSLEDAIEKTVMTLH